MNIGSKPTLSLEGACWHCAPDENSVSALMQTNGISRFLATCLALVGIKPGEETETFLHPSLDHLYDPFLMLDMKKAADRIRQAIQNREHIRIVTDYDVDGTMSSLILQSTLSLCGHQRVSYHIPDRKDEGYGFSMTAAQKAIADGISLIITADIGVRDEASIAEARAHNIDVIILDHHLPEGCGIPASAFAVLCPPQPGCAYPNKALAACGISLKFAQAMLADNPHAPQIIRSLMKLAALGTIADVVSLRDRENRAITAIGLESLNQGPHKPGLAALLDVSKAMPGSITSSTVGFSIAPRINAAGRMSSAAIVIDLLHAGNRVQAQGLASRLDAMNGDRKYIQDMMTERAVSALEHCDDPFLFLAFPEDIEWHSGIAGIVAGRVREKFGRPTAIGTVRGGFITGSIRSTPGIHAVKALTSVGNLLTKFGGHAAAAGFTCPEENYEKVRQGLCCNALEQLHGETELNITETAIRMKPQEISLSIYDDLDKLEPCGTDNHRPLICIENVLLANIRWIKDIHLGASVQCKDFTLEIIYFSAPSAIQSMIASPVRLVGELQRENWNGSVRYKMIVRDICLQNINIFI